MSSQDLSSEVMFPEAMFPEIMRDEVFRLETQRLWLRWPRIGDAEAITAMVADPEVAATTSHIPHPYPDGEALRHIVRSRTSNEAGNTAIFVMTRKGGPAKDRSDFPVGMIGLHIAGAEAPRIGYLVGRPHWGSGFATESLRAVVSAAFLLTPFASIWGDAMSCNPASRRVQELCGFVYTGSAVEHFPAREGMIAVDHMALTRERWAGLPRGRGTGDPAPSVDRGIVDSACL